MPMKPETKVEIAKYVSNISEGLTQMVVVLEERDVLREALIAALADAQPLHTFNNETQQHEEKWPMWVMQAREALAFKSDAHTEATLEVVV